MSTKVKFDKKHYPSLYHQEISIQTADLAVLMANMFIAMNDPEIGYEHANSPAFRLIRRVQRNTLVREVDLESMLWAANLLDENGKFFSPPSNPAGTSETFKEFVNRLYAKRVFNRDFNYFKNSSDHVDED